MEKVDNFTSCHTQKSPNQAPVDADNTHDAHIAQNRLLAQVFSNFILYKNTISIQNTTERLQKI